MTRGDRGRVKLTKSACYSGPVQLTKGLNEAQKQAVEHRSGPLLIVAGAGAGKTKTITHRITWLVSQGVPASQILALTFTNKAATEMRTRALRLLADEGLTSEKPPFVSTFHALSVRLLREFGSEVGVPRSFVIWDRDDSIRTIKKAIKALDLGEKSPREILGAISRAKGEGKDIAAYEKTAQSYQERLVVQVWRHYEKSCKEEQTLDFDDLLLKTHEILKTSESVRERLRRRWTYLIIDEYQDTSAIQYDIAEFLTGPERNICVVGDLDQCIYTWRQAKLENLLLFEKSFPGTKVVMLEQNYRSTQTILTAANAVIEKNTHRHPKRLYTDNPTGEAIRVFRAVDEQDEARMIAQSVRELLGSGVRASEIAILFRENFLSRSLEDALIRMGIPYKVLGTRFFERAEVKDVLSYLRLALNPQSQGDFARAVASPSRGIGATTLEKIFAGKEDLLAAAAKAKVAVFRAQMARIRDTLTSLKASDALRFVVTESGLENALKNGTEEDKERLQNIAELVSLAVGYDEYNAPEGIERILEDAALMSDQDERNEKIEAVSLMTIHASKGLEFDAVYVTGLEQGLFPSLRDSTRDPEEERRLCYVALTRARSYLHLSYAMSRLKYGSREYALPSEFLDDIDPRLVHYEPSAIPEKRTRQGRGILDMYEDEDTII